MIEIIHGTGMIEKSIPGMMRIYAKYDYDIRKYPMLVYPTLHYQNGGLEIDGQGTTKVKNLYVAGEAVGGIHERNRLMGNSLLDIIVFGRNAGRNAAASAKNVRPGALSLAHIKRYKAERVAAGISTEVASPLLLPNYTQR